MNRWLSVLFVIAGCAVVTADEGDLQALWDSLSTQDERLTALETQSGFYWEHPSGEFLQAYAGDRFHVGRGLHVASPEWIDIDRQELRTDSPYYSPVCGSDDTVRALRNDEAQAYGALRELEQGFHLDPSAVAWIDEATGPYRAGWHRFECATGPMWECVPDSAGADDQRIFYDPSRCEMVFLYPVEINHELVEHLADRQLVYGSLLDLRASR